MIADHGMNFTTCFRHNTMADKSILNDSFDPAALNAGKEEAFGYIYKRYYQSLCLFASRMVSDEDAEDMVDEAFIAVWKKRVQFRDENHLKSFLYLSVRNACLNILKTGERAGERQHQFITDRGDSEECYLFHLLEAEVLRELNEAVESLPPQCRKIIHLTYLEGKANPEVAEELNISVHTVKNQKRRGLDLLREKLVSNKEYLVLILPLLRILA